MSVARTMFSKMISSWPSELIYGSEIVRPTKERPSWEMREENGSGRGGGRVGMRADAPLPGGGPSLGRRRWGERPFSPPLADPEINSMTDLSIAVARIGNTRI